MITRTYRDDTVKIADRVLCMCGKLVLRSLDRSARCEIVCFGVLGWLVSINRFKLIGWLFVSFILSGNICKNPLCMLRPEIRVQYARWRFNLHYIRVHADICSLLSIGSALYHPPFLIYLPCTIAHQVRSSPIIAYNRTPPLAHDHLLLLRVARARFLFIIVSLWTERANVRTSLPQMIYDFIYSVAYEYIYIYGRSTNQPIQLWRERAPPQLYIYSANLGP